MALMAGDTATFSFSGETLAVANFGRWRLSANRPIARYNPFTWAMDRVAIGPLGGAGTLEMAPDTTTPIIPAGTSGTLVLTLNTGKTFTVKARLYEVSIVASMTPWDVTRAAYGFILCAEASTDTIAVA